MKKLVILLLALSIGIVGLTRVAHAWIVPSYYIHPGVDCVAENPIFDGPQIIHRNGAQELVLELNSNHRALHLLCKINVPSGVYITKIVPDISPIRIDLTGTYKLELIQGSTVLDSMTLTSDDYAGAADPLWANSMQSSSTPIFLKISILTCCQETEFGTFDIYVQQ